MDRADTCDKFLDKVEFDLYPFQEEALLAWFESPGGVLVTAPTGMGKTLIAEAAIFEALHTRQRLYYTTPLIALTDQKFREFQDKAESWGFPRDEVGLITGNRRVNPDALVRVVVAEILLNHLLADDEGIRDVCGVVMDEFHFFNDYDRGIVWELSLALLPPNIRLMLLSATVGNPVEFMGWLREEFDRRLRLVRTDERRVPLDFQWVADKILAEHLPSMVADDDASNRTPALVFCFDRDECWAVAERLKGCKLTDPTVRAQIEAIINPEDFAQGIGPKLKQMLMCGAGVHHAGVLPKHKEIVETLFTKKLIPFVVCTETLAAGINLPARSVVITTLMKGKRGEKKLIAPSSAHQMFGRAGRPQFDTQGYVYAMTHEDDAKIAKWKKRYEQIDPKSKDPGIMRARKNLERKRPTRRKTVQYWSEGQFKTIIEAGPAKLISRSMIPYRFLIYLLGKSGTLRETRAFLAHRFAPEPQIERFQNQLAYMIDNLAALGYLTRGDDGDHITLHDNMSSLLGFRSIDPLYGAFLVDRLKRGSFDEKLQTLESVLPLPPALRRKTQLPELEPGPLQREQVIPDLIRQGIVVAQPQSHNPELADDEPTTAGDTRRSSVGDFWDDDGPREPDNLPDMLKALFDAMLPSPEDVFVQPKWVAGGIFEVSGDAPTADRSADDFHKFCRARDLMKNEGLVLRHLLRLIILAGEFIAQSEGDPDYERIVESCTQVCREVDTRYTERFLESDAEAKQLVKL